MDPQPPSPSLGPNKETAAKKKKSRGGEYESYTMVFVLPWPRKESSLSCFTFSYATTRGGVQELAENWSETRP